MLALPSFLREGEGDERSPSADRESMAAAFRLTQFFLHRHVYEPRGLTANDAREGFVQAALKALTKPAERQAS
jgi:DNA repair protein RecO (recombination protein O)